MSVVVVNEMVNCSNCEYFELEGIEAVCTHFNEVLVFYVEDCMCSAYKKKGEKHDSSRI